MNQKNTNARPAEHCTRKKAFCYMKKVLQSRDFSSKLHPVIVFPPKPRQQQLAVAKSVWREAQQWTSRHQRSL